jgi:trimeric autotransporter adhesin
VRVQRASDSAQQDVGFGAGGYIDMAAAIAFQGASTLSVVTWYDMSGNGHHATGTTARLRWQNTMNGLQPLSMIASTGNAAAGTLTIPNTLTVNRQAYTAISVLSPAGGVANTWGHFSLGTSATSTDNVNVLYDNTGGAAAVEYWFDGAFRNTNRKNFSIPIGLSSCVIVRSDASNARFRLNGIETSVAASTSVTLTGGYIGRATWSSAAIGLVEMFMLAVYDRTITAAECQQVEASMEASYGVPLRRSGIVVFDGDSITAGLNTGNFMLNLTRQAYNLTRNNLFHFNMAVAGQSMATLYTNRASATARYDSALARNYSHIFAGTNDIDGRASGSIVGHGTTVWTNSLFPYIQAMQTAGFNRVIVGAMLPRLWSGSAQDIIDKEAERLAYNSLITSNAGTYNYVVADYASLYSGNPSAYTTGGGSTDGIHPTIATYGLMAPICAAAISA